MLRNLLRALLLFVSLCAASQVALAKEILFWHSMSGARGEELDKLAARYNAQQPELRIVPVYKGPYDQALAAALAAHKAGKGPHLLQVYEVGTADLMNAKDVVRPLWQVMKEAGVPLEAKYLPAVSAYFSDGSGKLLALPFNTSTPVLYFNRDAFRNAKLDPARPPKTWYEMPATLGALREAGSHCPFTTAWQSWVLLENMSAWHNQEFATHANGMDNANARLAFNSRLMMRWISMLSSWNKSGYFIYAGRGNEAEARFASGECAVLTSSSSSYADLKKNAKFDFAVAQLPHYDDWEGSPQNTLIGGAGLWVMAGKAKDEYQGAAKFLGWLSQPDVQAEWHQKTGYVPLTTAAYELARKQGFYASHPWHEVAVRQLLLKNPTKDSKGIRLPHFAKIRGIIDEELEHVWGGKKTPMDALNAAVKRGNGLLERPAR